MLALDKTRLTAVAAIVIGSFFTTNTFASASSLDAMYSPYKATETFSGKSATLDAKSHPYARRYRTVLSGQLSAGPNFAGRYVIASWGCGTSCLAHAIIDANTGKVYVPKAIESSSMNFPCDIDSGLHYRRNSSLLIQVVPDGLEEAVVTAYNWKQRKLQKMESSKWPMERACQTFANPPQNT